MPRNGRPAPAPRPLVNYFPVSRALHRQPHCVSDEDWEKNRSRIITLAYRHPDGELYEESRKNADNEEMARDRQTTHSKAVQINAPKTWTSSQAVDAVMLPNPSRLQVTQRHNLRAKLNQERVRDFEGKLVKLYLIKVIFTQTYC